MITGFRFTHYLECARCREPVKIESLTVPLKCTCITNREKRKARKSLLRPSFYYEKCKYCDTTIRVLSHTLPYEVICSKCLLIDEL